MIGIVAHTSRAGQAKRLAAGVRADFISIDNGLMGCDGNHEHVLHHLAGFPSTWSVVLEDDAEPVEGFRDQLGQALMMAPSPIVSLYLGRQRPPHWQRRIGAAVAEAEESGASWVVATRLFHAVGYCVKTELLPSLLSHVSPLPVDEHVSSWARAFGHVVSYAVPSLVEHSDVPTVVEHRDGAPRTPGRKAWRVGVRDRWSSMSVVLR